MNVEPIIFLGGQGQQRLPKGALDGTQLFATGPLFLGATLRVNDLDQLCLERLQPLAQGNIGGIVDDPRACAGRETDERRIEMPLQIPQIPRRARKMIKQGETVDDTRSTAVKALRSSYPTARSGRARHRYLRAACATAAADVGAGLHTVAALLRIACAPSCRRR